MVRTGKEKREGGRVNDSTVTQHGEGERAMFEDEEYE